MTALWSGLLKQFVPSKEDVDCGDGLTTEKVDTAISSYNGYFDAKNDGKKKEERKHEAQKMVNHYYDLVTDFYEYGWGQSFHFAPRFNGESFTESIARHEYYLASRMGMRAGHLVLDVGCGVGGPQRNIVRFSGSKVVGLNNNEYQVKRATRLNSKAKLSHLTDVVKGDFMQMPFEAATFDHVYAIEATCHAPDRVGCFSEVFRVLKEGGIFACYEWGMTDNYDDSNAKHRSIKHGIEEGNSLPTLVPNKNIVDSVRKAGFEVLEWADMAEHLKNQGFDVGWHSTLKGGCHNLSAMRHSKGGRFLTHQMVTVFEFLRIAPKGTVATHNMLTKTADALADSGDLEIFTPMLFILARKPVSPKKTN